MLGRFLKLRSQVNTILFEDHASPLMLSNSEIDTAQEFTMLLAPFEVATKLISAEKYLTASKVIPIVTTILISLQNILPTTAEGQHLNKLLLNEFSKWFNLIEHERHLQIATILDPRYKKTKFMNKRAAANAVRQIERELERMAGESSKPAEDKRPEKRPSDQEDFWSFMRILREETIQDRRNQQIRSGEIDLQIFFVLERQYS